MVPSGQGWHHFAVVATNGQAMPIFYVDTVERAFASSGGVALINLFPSTRPLHIGAQVDPSYSYFGKNLIDELAIYNRALSSNEVAAIYEAGSAGKCISGAPNIVLQPRSQTVSYWQSSTFTVVATGSRPLAYQWQFNGTNLLAGTNDTLTLTDVGTNHAGNYQVIITNQFGAATSSVAVLTVVPPSGTAYWDGGGDSTSWSDALNWSDNRLPGATNEVVITGGAGTNVVISSGSITVKSIQCSKAFTISGGALTVTDGASQISGTFTMPGGTSLATAGSNTVFTATGSANIDNASLSVSGGAVLSLPGVRSYQSPGYGRMWSVGGTGSLLGLPGLTNIGAAYVLAVNATAGGQADLSNLGGITNGFVDVIADGSNSVVNLSSLTQFSGASAGRWFELEAKNGGAITIPGLVDGAGVSVILHPGGTISTTQFQQLANVTADGVMIHLPSLVSVSGTITLNGVTIHLPSLGSVSGGITLNAGSLFDAPMLTNIDNASLSVSGGAVLSLPGVRTYQSPGYDRMWSVSGAGSLLGLPGLTNIGLAYVLTVKATVGGQADLSNLRGITNGFVDVIADGSNSVVNLNSLTQFSGAPAGRWFELEAKNGGAILLPLLARTDSTTVTISTNSALTFPSLTNFLSGEITVKGGAASFPVAVISNSVFNLYGGSLQSALVFDNSTLNIGTNVAAPGFFSFQNISNALTGRLASQQTARVLGGAGGTNAALRLAAGATNAGTILLDAVNGAYSATLLVQSNLLLINDLTGSIQALPGTGGSRTLAGSVRSAGAVSAGPGSTFALTGNYEQAGGGRLDIAIGAAGPGGLAVKGTATLAGALSATFTNGFYPAPNALFTFLTNAVRSGTFSAFSFQSNIVGLQVVYGAASSVIEVINTLPLIPVLPDVGVDELTTLSVNVNATDGDTPAQSLTYGLANAPAGASISAAGLVTWTPTEAQGPMVTNITVVVTDNGAPNLTSTRTFQVDVREINVPPVLTLPGTQTLNELTSLSVSASATDADIPTNALRFALVSPPSGMAINATNGAITWTPSEQQGPSTNEIRVSVTDTNPVASNAKELSVTNSFTVIVNEVNLAPVLTVPPPQTINELATLTVTNTATDGDYPANMLTFALLSGPSNAVLNAVSGVLTWTPSEAEGPGTNTFVVSVTDFNPWAVNAQQLGMTNSFTVVVNETNAVPVLTVPTNDVINELVLYTATATATDSDVPTNALTFALVSAPTGMVIGATSGVITWTPSEAQGPSTNVIFVSVTDTNPWALSAKSLSVTGSFTLIVREVNSGPVLTPMPDQTIHALTTLSTNATATDADLPPQTLVFSLVAGPVGLSVSPGGLVTWTPEDTQVGTANVTVRVADGGTPELSDTNSFSVTVVARPTLSISSVTSSNLTLNWTAIPGHSYRVQERPDLGATEWADLGGDVTASASTASQTDVLPATNRLYRVRVLP